MKICDLLERRNIDTLCTYNFNNKIYAENWSNFSIHIGAVKELVVLSIFAS